MTLGEAATVLNIAAWLVAIGYVLGWSQRRRAPGK